MYRSLGALSCNVSSQLFSLPPLTRATFAGRLELLDAVQVATAGGDQMWVRADALAMAEPCGACAAGCLAYVGAPMWCAGSARERRAMASALRQRFTTARWFGSRVPARLEHGRYMLQRSVEGARAVPRLRFVVDCASSTVTLTTSDPAAGDAGSLLELLDVAGMDAVRVLAAAAPLTPWAQALVTARDALR